MSQSERYIQEVTQHLLATQEERARFEADLRAHFEEAASREEPIARTIDKLGTSETVAEAFNAERPLEYAGFWKRLAAFLGDVALFEAISVPIVIALVLTENDVLTWRFGIVLLVLMGIAVFGMSLVYFPLLETRFGKTLGKYLMKIRVVDEGAKPITLGQSIIRRLSFYFDLLVLDAIFVPFTDRKQRGLDILAKTVVVNEPGEKASVVAWILCLTAWAAIALCMIGIVFLATH